MKITKKNLKLLIEKFLFEEESGINSGNDEQNKNQSVVKNDDFLHKKDEIIESVDVVREFLYNNQDFINSISDNKKLLIDTVDSVPGLQPKDKTLCKDMINKLETLKNDSLSMNYIYDTEKVVDEFIKKYQNSPLKKDKETIEAVNEFIDLILSDKSKKRFKEFTDLIKKFKSGSNIIEKGYNIFVFLQVMIMLTYVARDFNDYLISNRSLFGVSVKEKDMPSLKMNYVISSTFVDVVELIKSFMSLMNLYIKLGESPNNLEDFVKDYESKSIKDFKRQSNIKNIMNTGK